MGISYEQGLSVIIPCYNSAKTIEKCINSVLTDKIDLEIIIIDDCSTDNSKEIINHLQQTSNCQIKYYRNNINLGAGKTRNKGIIYAKKKYIMFVDSDDELSGSFYEEIIKYLDNDYDQIVFDATKIDEIKTSTINMYYSDKINQGIVKSNENLVYIKGSTWGKIYRNQIVQENNIKFGELKRNEDLIFTKLAASYSSKIVYIKKPLYVYINNPESLMNNIILLTPQNAVDAFAQIKERLSNRNFEKELNSIMLIELLYSTTTTNIKLGKTRKEIRLAYKKYRSSYESEDIYRRRYNKIYIISYYMFEFKLFKTYGIIRRYAEKRKGQ